MKTVILFVLIFVGVHGFAQSIKHREVYFLLDVTDKELFQLIKRDIQTNLPTFFKNTGFADIKAMQRFSLHLAPVSSNSNLQLNSASIVIPRKGLSYSAENELRNPKPLVFLLKNELIEYERISSEQLQATSVLDVFFKALLQADSESESWFFLFSDLIENNKYINLYKRIPDSVEIAKVIKQIDPYIINKIRQKLDEGFEPKLVFVQKELPKSKIDIRKLKVFWESLLKELGFTEVQFIDNLSNTIEL